MVMVGNLENRPVAALTSENHGINPMFMEVRVMSEMKTRKTVRM